MKNLSVFIIVFYYRILKYFFGELDSSIIPEGLYCYVPDDEKNAKENSNFTFYIKPCPYYRSMSGQYNAGCLFTGRAGFDLSLGDQCKICSKNINY